MKKLYVLWFGMLLIMFCSRNKNPLSPDAISKNIIGVWKTDKSTICLNADNTFIDSTYYYSNPDNILILGYVLEGIYSIEDDILKYDQFVVTYALEDTSWHYKLLASPYFKSISFINDSLLLTAVNIFNPIEGNGNQLSGKWNETRYACIYKLNPLQIEYTGRITDIYIFSEPRPVNDYYSYDVSFDSEFPDGHDKIYFGANFGAKFEPPYLSTSNPILGTNILVEFIDSKMYWFNNTESYVKIR